MHRHLDTGLCTGTFENDVETLFLAKGTQRKSCVVLCSPKLIFCVLGFVGRRETKDLFGETVLLGKFAARFVDINSCNTRGSHTLCEGACKDTNSACAEDEDRLSRDKTSPS